MSENLPIKRIDDVLKSINRDDLIELLYRENQEKKDLQVQVENQKDKVDFYEAVTSSDDLVSMAEVSKILSYDGYGRNKLFEFLRDSEILRHNNQPFQQYVPDKFKIIETQKTDKYGNVKIFLVTMVTQKGMDFIRKKLNEAVK